MLDMDGHLTVVTGMFVGPRWDVGKSMGQKAKQTRLASQKAKQTRLASLYYKETFGYYLSEKTPSKHLKNSNVILPYLSSHALDM